MKADKKLREFMECPEKRREVMKLLPSLCNQ